MANIYYTGSQSNDTSFDDVLVSSRGILTVTVTNGLLYGNIQLTENTTIDPTMVIGAMTIIHGICTWVCGYFPMDADPFTKNPTFNCKVHSWAGFIMLLSLVIAPILIAISPTTDIIPLYFRIFSVVTVVGAVYYLITMAKAIKSQSNPGIHQRISYGIQLIWLSVFSLLLV